MNATKTEIAAVLREVKGNVAAAATRLKVARADLAAAVQDDEKLSAIVDDYRSELVDFAETQLRKAIANGCDWAIRYVLDSARAQPRGWRKQTIGSQGAVPAPPSSLSDEQLAEMNRQILEG